ncbi:MAG: HigA family addiction module antitoxin [Deltaproteobacteria bacterium]
MTKMKDAPCLPNYAIPPGETLRETLETIGMTQAELAERTGRPKKTINEIVAGKAAITAETSLQLERVLGISASFWNNLERNYQETLARLREEKKFDEEKAWIKRFPVAALTKMGWIPNEDSPAKTLRVILNFFGVAGIEEWKALWEKPEAAYRNSKAYQTNHYAVAAWLRKGEIEASRIETKPYNVRSFKEALRDLRRLTTERSEIFEPEMKKVCAEGGVAVAFVPELPGTHVYGATRWRKAKKAIIQMSLRGKTDDHLWFTFFHEAGHIVRHGKEDIFIETGDGDYLERGRKEKEEEADQFSQDLLIPPDEYRAFLDNKQFDLTAVKAFSRKLGIAPGVVVGRLQHDKVIPFNQGNSLKKKFRFADQ